MKREEAWAEIKASCSVEQTPGCRPAEPAHDFRSPWSLSAPLLIPPPALEPPAQAACYLSKGEALQLTCFFFFKILFYLLMREIQSEREAEIQAEGEAGSMQEA